MTKTREELIHWAEANPNVAALYAPIRSDGVNHFSVVLDEYRREDGAAVVGIAAYMLTVASHLREYTGGVEYYEEVSPKKYGTYYECLYKRGDAKPKKPWARVKDLVTPHTKSKEQVSKALNAGMKEHRTRLERMVAGVERDVYKAQRQVLKEVHARTPFSAPHLVSEFGAYRPEECAQATKAAKAVGISARKEPAPLYYDQGEDEFACTADEVRRVNINNETGRGRDR